MRSNIKGRLLLMFYECLSPCGSEAAESWFKKCRTISKSKMQRVRFGECNSESKGWGAVCWTRASP